MTLLPPSTLPLNTPYGAIKRVDYTETSAFGSADDAYAARLLAIPGAAGVYALRRSAYHSAAMTRHPGYRRQTFSFLMIGMIAALACTWDKTARDGAARREKCAQLARESVGHALPRTAPGYGHPPTATAEYS